MVVARGGEEDFVGGGGGGRKRGAAPAVEVAFFPSVVLVVVLLFAIIADRQCPAESAAGERLQPLSLWHLDAMELAVVAAGTWQEAGKHEKAARRHFGEEDDGRARENRPPS